MTLLRSLRSLAWHVAPTAFPDGAHLLLGAMPLALIAVSYLVYQV